MKTVESFHYEPRCIIPGCNQLALYKVGATWNSGQFSELKNYGTCCEEHKATLLERARTAARSTRLADGESLGEVMLYRLTTGRDAELSPVDD